MPKICLGEDGFVNTGHLQGPPIHRDEILAFAQREGFQGIELHALFETYDRSVAAATQDYYSKYGLEIPGIQTGHIGFFHSPISDEESDRKEYVEAVEDAQRFAEAIGARHSTLTPPVFTQDMSKDYDRLLARYTGVVSEVVARAEKHGVVMAIEPEPNLFLNGGGIRKSLEDVRAILNEIDSKNLAILYDVAHVNVISHGDPVGFLKALGGRVSWVHAADNDFTLTPIGTGKHLVFGEGNVDMARLFKALKKECPKLGWLQIDTWENPDPFGTAKKNKEGVAKILREINWAS
jgi:sugar phosphate isomerase/epimerase